MRACPHLEHERNKESFMARARYIATVGLDFEGLKPPVRVDEGQPVPNRVGDKEIKELLAAGMITLNAEQDESEVTGNE